MRQPVAQAVSLATLIALLGSGAAPAAVDAWSRVGPDGGEIRVITYHPTDPSIVLAGTAGGGIWKSVDGGASWYLTTDDRDLRYITVGIEFDPADPSRLVAIGSRTRLMKSADGGETWQSINVGPGFSRTPLAMAVNPLDFDEIYVGQTERFRKTTDGGATWTNILGDAVESLAIDPVVTSTVYAASENRLLRSTESGANFSPVDTSFAVESVRWVVTSPFASGTVYAATGDLVYRSTDFGDTWAQLGAPLPYGAHRLMVDLGEAGALYASGFGGLHRWNDTDAAWIEVRSLGEGEVAFDAAFTPGNPARRFLGGLLSEAILLSGDSGATWSASAAGLQASHLYDHHIEPSRPSQVLTGTRWTGAYRTVNATTSWGKIADVPTQGVRVFAGAPSDPDVVYAGLIEGSLYRSTDGGATFSPVGGLPSEVSILSVAVDPLDADIAFAGAGTIGAFKTTDGGATWAALDLGLSGFASVWSVAIDPSNPSTVFAGTSHASTPVVKSIDGGTTWAPASTGLTGGTTVADFEFAPSDPTRLYAAQLTRGVFVTTDGGASWTELTGASGPDCRSLAVDPVDATVVYVGQLLSSLPVLRYDGSTWSPFDTDLDVEGVTSIGFHPTSPSTLYATTFGGGLWRYSISGVIFSDGFESGDTTAWTATAP